MSDFDTWFRKQAGEDPDSCDWLITFIRSNNANEVEQIFEGHYRILMSEEMVEELKGMIEIMQSRIPNPSALYAIKQAQERLTLITDAQLMGVQEAIKMHKLQQMKDLLSQSSYQETLQVGLTLLAKLPVNDHPKLALVFYNMGTCYNELGQYAAAVQEDSSDSDTWYNHANNQHQWGICAKD